MTDEFISLGVRNGDSFFLKRNEITALIDGGEDELLMTDLFFASTHSRYIDILVCTHPDEDHIAGIIGFLKNPLFLCRELWLPSYIGKLSKDILTCPEAALRQLINGLTNKLCRLFSMKNIFLGAKEGFESSSLNNCGNLNSEIVNLMEKDIDLSRKSVSDSSTADNNSSFRSLNDKPLLDKSAEPAILEINLGYKEMIQYERSIDSLKRALSVIPHSKNGCVVCDCDERKAFMLFLASNSCVNLYVKYIDLFDRIRVLIELAANRRIPVRFFEYNSINSSGGIHGVLEPVNSLEVSLVKLQQPSQIGEDITSLLFLSTQNRTSLVFYSPQCPAVLFTADSDLKFKQSISWTNGMIITAPHHGSIHNQNAYDRFSKEAPSCSPLWIMTHHPSVRKGTSFFNLNNSQVLYRSLLDKKRRNSHFFKADNGRWNLKKTETVSFQAKKYYLLKK